MTSEGCARYGCGCVFLAPFVLIGPIFLAVLAFDGGFSFVEVLVVPFFLLVPGGILGLLGGKLLPLELETRRLLGTVGKFVFGFAILCLITTVGLTLRPSDFSVEEQVSAGGGLAGPLEIPEDNMRVEVEIEQRIDPASANTFQRWSFVTVELLDENEEYLSSFGGEFWHEAGYDGGDYWQQDDEAYEATLRVPTAGTYYVRLQTESDVPETELSPVTIRVHEQARWGNPAPFQAVGFVAFVLGLALLILPRVESSSAVIGKLEEGATVHFEDQAWIVRGQVHYNYGEWTSDEWTLHPSGPGAKTPRYLECEEGSNWYWSRPVDLEELQCTDTDGFETDVLHYASAHDELPEVITYDDETYGLENSGTAYREGAQIPYHTYEKSGDFVTVEGSPSDTLSAVVGRPIRASELSVEAAPEGNGDRGSDQFSGGAEGDQV